MISYLSFYSHMLLKQKDVNAHCWLLLTFRWGLILTSTESPWKTFTIHICQWLQRTLPSSDNCSYCLRNNQFLLRSGSWRITSSLADRKEQKGYYRCWNTLQKESLWNVYANVLWKQDFLANDTFAIFQLYILFFLWLLTKTKNRSWLFCSYLWELGL